METGLRSMEGRERYCETEIWRDLSGVWFEGRAQEYMNAILPWLDAQGSMMMMIVLCCCRFGASRDVGAFGASVVLAAGACCPSRASPWSCQKDMPLLPLDVLTMRKDR
jgi:hypothetical protein